MSMGVLPSIASEWASRDDGAALAPLPHLVRAQLELAVAAEFAGLHVVFVAVPRADEVQVVAEGLPLVGAVGRHDVDHLVDQQALAGRSTLVDAQIAVGVEAAAGEEHADLVASGGDDAPVSVGHLRRLGDEPFGHACFPREKMRARLFKKKERKPNAGGGGGGGGRGGG